MNEIIKKMYNVQDLFKVPINVLQAIEDADELCRRAGGQLVSRQVIAAIIVEHDTLKTYDKESKYYIGA